MGLAFSGDSGTSTKALSKVLNDIMVTVATTNQNTVTKSVNASSNAGQTVVMRGDSLSGSTVNITNSLSQRIIDTSNTNFSNASKNALSADLASSNSSIMKAVAELGSQWGTKNAVENDNEIRNSVKNVISTTNINQVIDRFNADARVGQNVLVDYQRVSGSTFNITNTADVAIEKVSEVMANSISANVQAIAARSKNEADTSSQSKGLNSIVDTIGGTISGVVKSVMSTGNMLILGVVLIIIVVIGGIGYTLTHTDPEVQKQLISAVASKV